jgi:hypothetical protein
LNAAKQKNTFPDLYAGMPKLTQWTAPGILESTNAWILSKIGRTFSAAAAMYCS